MLLLESSAPKRLNNILRLFGNVKNRGCNTFSTSDSANFLSLLLELRSALGNSSLITAAVSVSGLVGPDGQALKDLSAVSLLFFAATSALLTLIETSSQFAGPLDFINLMAYDIS